MIISTIFTMTSTFFILSAISFQDTAAGEVMPDIVSELEELLGKVGDEVSALANHEIIAINTCMSCKQNTDDSEKLINAKERRVNLLGDICKKAVDAKLCIGESFKFWELQEKATSDDIAKEKARLDLLIVLLNMLPYCFGQGGFQLSDTSREAMAEALHHLEKRQKKPQKKGSEGFEKLRGALLKVQESLQGLNKVTAMSSLILVFHHGGATMKHFIESATIFESIYEDVYKYFESTNLKEEVSAIQEEVKKNSEVLEYHLKDGERAREELDNMLKNGPDHVEKTKMWEDVLSNALTYADYEMSFLIRQELERPISQLKILLKNMETTMFVIRIKKLRSYLPQSDYAQ